MSWDKASTKKYFEGKKALVVDQNLNAGKSLRKILMTHGIQGDLILVSAHFAEAKKLIQQHQPHILICDLELGSDSGLELISDHIAMMPNRLEGTTILMAGDTSAANLGTYAEAQVDSILLKPYTLLTLDECLKSAFIEKLYPTPFQIQFEQARREFNAGQYLEANLTCEDALEKNDKYTPLYSLYAQVCVKLEDFDKAELLLKRGLTADPQSFLCMNGLFDLYMAAKKHPLAYSIAEAMHQKYPPTASRLLELVKLSMYCAKFEDIISYCNHFKSLITTETALNRAIIAALLICSKYFRGKDQATLSTDVLKDAARISIRTGLLQLEVFRYLIENKDLDLADSFYSNLLEEVRQKPETSILRMELLSHFGDHAQLMSIGQNLVKEKLDTARVYELMIDSSKKLNRSEQAIENLILESQTRHPET